MHALIFVEFYNNVCFPDFESDRCGGECSLNFVSLDLHVAFSVLKST